MNAAAVAEDRDAGRLVDGHIAPDAATKALCDELGIAAEGRDNVAVEPAAFVLQGAGQVPVIEGDHRFDAVFQKFVNQLVVKAQTGFVDFAVAVGDDPGPADREAVSLDAEFLHQGDVLAEAMVDIAGDIACVAAADMPGGIVAEVVPDARPFTVFIPGAFTLIGGAGDAPQKLFGKLFHGYSFVIGLSHNSFGDSVLSFLQLHGREGNLSYPSFSFCNRNLGLSEDSALACKALYV